jgi:hypothetical protein
MHVRHGKFFERTALSSRHYSRWNTSGPAGGLASPADMVTTFNKGMCADD